MFPLREMFQMIDIFQIIDVPVKRDVPDDRDAKKFSCISYQDDVFFQCCLFEVVLIKDILTIKNEI